MENQFSPCLLCSKVATTKEHIIPRWLQKHFGLENQKLGLWNKTAILYKQATINLCQNCNGNILSKLEKKVEASSASDNDYYLWGLKIRFLLSVKDSTLLLNQKDKSEGFLITKEEGYYGQQFVQAALKSITIPNFIFKPNPFGSVFLFDNPIKDGQFGFVDAPFPYWSVTIALPKHKVLAVLLTDKGMVRNAISQRYKNKGGLKGYLNNIPATSTSQLLHILMLKLLINQYEIMNIPYRVSVAENSIYSPSLPGYANFRKKHKKEIYIHLVQTLGLDAQVGIELYNKLPKKMQI